jgi:predicted acylesterase/phospholipase RssA
MNKKMDIPEKERAVVLQGGGSLGAYEAGAYRALYESLSKKDLKEGKKGRSTFDIVAGTSIGAINAAVLVSYVVENQQQGGTFQLKSLRYLEYQMSFILIDLHVTVNFTIWTILGIVIATNL